MMKFKIWLNESENKLPVFIGDVHGKHDEYLNLIKNHRSTIQVGDLGFDYSKIPHSDNHKFIKGNHDNYNSNHSNDLGNHGMHNGIFYVRGAQSVDKNGRIEGKNWWRNEELNYREMSEAIQEYEVAKPNYVVSHDCPQSIAELFYDIHDASITRQGLQRMLEIHQPSIWVFGHHHRHRDEKVGKTRFVCVEELQTFDPNQ